MNEPLAIVGASARAAAGSAARAGFQPIAADLFADLDLRAMATSTRIAPYPEGLLDWLRTVEPSAWMYTGALENHAELVDQMAWIAPLWGNSGEVLARVRSPRELAAAMHGAGLLFPETRASAEGLPRDGSWLAKSYRGASGSGVSAWVGSHRARSAEHEEAGGACYQRCVGGLPVAAVFVAADGGAALLGVTRQLVGEAWLGANRFQYAGSIGPLKLSEATVVAIARCGEVLAERFELVGLFGVDFMLDDARVWMLEVNPRYTASVEIVERASGISAIGLHAAACKESRIGDGGLPIQNAGLNSSRMHGKAILFAKREVVVSEEFAAMGLSEASRRPWPTLADISAAGSAIDAGRPVITVFAEGSSVEDVEQRLCKRVAEIERSLYPGP